MRKHWMFIDIFLYSWTSSLCIMLWKLSLRPLANFETRGPGLQDVGKKILSCYNVIFQGCSRVNFVHFYPEQVLHQDVLSYQRVIDSVNDKAQSLVHSSSDPQLSKFVTQAHARYQKLCIAAKVRGYIVDPSDRFCSWSLILWVLSQWL